MAALCAWIKRFLTCCSDTFEILSASHAQHECATAARHRPGDLLEIEGVDLQPCGGTHVSSTPEIGAVVVTKIKKKSSMTRWVVLGFLD